MPMSEERRMLRDEIVRLADECDTAGEMAVSGILCAVVGAMSNGDERELLDLVADWAQTKLRLWDRIVTERGTVN